MKALFTALVMILLIPTVGNAAGKNAWTKCGIGALIFPSVGWAAAISNVIWDLGTTATTSSSTTPSQCAGKGSSVGKLIYENYANVEEETAVGHGEHLNAMMSVLGCDGSVRSAMLQDVRADFLKSAQDANFSKKSTVEKTQSLFDNVMDKAANKYAQHCSVG